MSPQAHVAPMPINPSGAVEQDRKLIDRIIYLGSLASQRSDIDPMMEPLREITANWQDTEALSAEDRATLQQLESQLKTYLVKQDPIRAFTPDSLELRLHEQALHKTTTKRAMGVVLMLSVLAAGIGFAIPWPLSFNDRLLLMTPLFFLVLHIGIAWLYLTALKNFKPDMQRAFVYVCIGIIVLSIGFSHYVVIQLLGVGAHPVLKYGGITWLIGVPFIFIFLGLSIYGRLLKVKSRLLQWPVSLGIVGLLSLLLVVAPHAPVEDEFLFDFWMLGASMVTIFGLMSSVLAKKITDATTIAYAKSMHWLYYYMLVLGLGSILALASLFVLGGLHGIALSLVIAICGIPPQLVLLYTGYLFKRETSK